MQFFLFVLCSPMYSKCASQPSFAKECPLVLSVPALHDNINHVLILPKSRVTVIRQLNGHREVNL